MHDDYPSLIEYARWADLRMVEACRTLTPEQYAAEPVPGWSPVRATVAHMAIVTEGWLRALTGVAVDTWPTEEELATPDAAWAHLERGYDHFEALRARLTPEWLQTPLTITRRGRSLDLPPWTVLRQVINHGTYHRGQVASKLGRLGVKAPMTDFIAWAFEKLGIQF
jgi:uncharacterized damage-inducible protein DinB